MPTPSPVDVLRHRIVFPTYEPHAPDRNPMFLEKRVYQGSSGKVYPLPCTDRIAEQPKPRSWDAVVIENEFISVTILPELGGRIHRAQDKTNGYDFIYYQPVIKPALVGLTGPWASGGIEFNWPQHHRPSTFMPTDVAIEQHPDGSATVWLSEHDPMARMKGMHGVRLHPGKSYLELVVRAYNRTPDVQTFLWWSNVATRVNEQYQSFFPPDATHVADHAKRATGTYPLCDGKYYGVDYAARARDGVPANQQPRQFSPRTPGHSSRAQYAPNDLSWYANIPVPTSYMCMGSKQDFAGGYDHKARAGLVQIANHHIAPGKKQWTWGNQEFGYAWDRNLTVPDASGEYAPYIELMSGAYTDNQPDFSYLQPGETKSWSQFWYPIRGVGPVQAANENAAVRLSIDQGIARLGIATTAVHPDAIVRLHHGQRLIGEWTQTIGPDGPLLFETTVERTLSPEGLSLKVVTQDGNTLISYQPVAARPSAVPAPATEPLHPADVASIDELYLTGLHLEQYRHATRLPEDYWREALRRDSGDSRCRLALGRWHLRRGELDEAEENLRASIARSIARNPNPYDGEAYYQLGRCLQQKAFANHLDASTLDAAYEAFYKSTWNQAWQSAGYHALAEIDASRAHWTIALDHLNRALRLNTDNLRARNLKVVALRKLGSHQEATACLDETLALDPLDWWAKFLKDEAIDCDNQVRLDLALDHLRAGLFSEALAILEGAALGKLKKTRQSGPRPVDLPDASLGTVPLIHYYRAWVCHLLDDKRAEDRHLVAAAKAGPDYCFPARLEEITILRYALTTNPGDSRAPFYLGNLLYDRRRHREAITLWEQAVQRDARNAVAWRNLGIACFNILKQPAAARRAYDRAFKICPADARLLFERDQLWKRLGDKPARRLRELKRHLSLVHQRDDLSVELCALYNQIGKPDAARGIISSRRFQPWEGGEGQALGLHVRTHLALGREALAKKKAPLAIRHFEAALASPENLGEARHLLANQSDLHFWLGCAHQSNGNDAAAQTHWKTSASFKGDFQAMSVRSFSEMTYYSALALRKLGHKAEADRLLRNLLGYARRLGKTRATIDYFATSLPTMLLFDDDLQVRQQTSALFLEAQAQLGLGESAKGTTLLREVLRRDPNHAPATDLMA